MRHTETQILISKVESQMEEMLRRILVKLNPNIMCYFGGTIK